MTEADGCASFEYTLTFSLQLSKSTENLCQGGRVVGQNSMRRLGRPKGSLDWPPGVSVRFGYPRVTCSQLFVGSSAF
jgi:hypothetical protein